MMNVNSNELRTSAMYIGYIMLKEIKKAKH